MIVPETVDEVVDELTVLEVVEAAAVSVVEESIVDEEDEGLVVEVKLLAGVGLLVSVLLEAEELLLGGLEDVEDAEKLDNEELLVVVEGLLDDALVEAVLESLLAPIELGLVDETKKLLSNVTTLLANSWLLNIVIVELELVDENVEVKDPKEAEAVDEDKLEEAVVLEVATTRAPQIPAPQAPLSFGGPTPLFR